MEAVLKESGNFQALLGSYGIDICAKCLGANNEFEGSSTNVRFHIIEEGVNGVIFVFVSTDVREMLVILYHQEASVETIKLGVTL